MLFYEITSRRRNQDWLSLARIIAIGTGAGFSGKTTAIDKMARNLNVPYGSATMQIARDRMKQLHDTMRLQATERRRPS